jgi:hypothetical protein
MLAEPTQRHRIVVFCDDATQTQLSRRPSALTLERLADLVQSLCVARTTDAIHVRDSKS